MPEYIPPINNGAAEALASQANNLTASTPSPWAALLQGIAPSVQAVGKAKMDQYMGSSVDTPPSTPPSAPSQTQAQQFADPVWMAGEGW